MRRPSLLTALTVVLWPAGLAAQAELLDEVEAEVASLTKLTQVMVDKIFSFSELGQQEFETSAYVTGILEENGWQVERGSSGIPTALFARWGSGSPVISFGRPHLLIV
jgi:aminobenzoyl-glutamate utilization protein B